MQLQKVSLKKQVKIDLRTDRETSVLSDEQGVKMSLSEDEGLVKIKLPYGREVFFPLHQVEWMEPVQAKPKVEPVPVMDPSAKQTQTTKEPAKRGRPKKGK